MVLTVPLKMPKNRIRVYARFKPTDNFPHDLLSISKDGTVSFFDGLVICKV